MRSLTYFIAVSLDGRIAGPDGQSDVFATGAPFLAQLAKDWPDSLPTAFHEAMGTTAPIQRWDTVVMGRATFAPAIEAGIASPYEHLEQYVVSTTLDPGEHPGVRVVDEDPVGFVCRLKAQPGGDLWLCGGGALAGALIEEVDRLVLKLNPVTLGAGVPLLAHAFSPTRWELADHVAMEGGVMLLTYDRASEAPATLD